MGGRVRAFVQPVERYLQEQDRPSETVIIDPPRTGLSRIATEALAAAQIERLIYVSCDPATMARDIGRLAAAGYRLASLRAFDLFPNTPHVETLGVLDR
jgi:tRNA/tmRNA/rRNA uracil-C5-methylase (TrmA/RlmC/RlmD family)